ncbi:MAG: hypothetical protein DI570_08735 [Phenylobacterium zucineum]|nr:MAG: hypothetical protein DI570_08735 [Phenylobacterium zucineum]
MFERAAGALQAQARREERRARARLVAQVLGFAGFAAIAAAVPGLTILQEVMAARAEQRSWTIVGPACPVVSAPSKVATSRRRPPRTHRYGGAAFTRSFGAVSCAGFREPSLSQERLYHVCQFNNPGAVTVRAAGEVRTFEAAPGQPLAITLRDGEIRCVVGGWFRLK